MGPGGSHLAQRYTRRHVRDVWQATLMDQTGYDRWLAAGAATLGGRLREQTAALLAAPRPFELSSEARARVDDVLRRAETLKRQSV